MSVLKKVVVLVLLLLCSVSLFLFAYDNSLSSYLSSSSFSSFMSVLKDSRQSRSSVDKAYENFLQENPSGYGRARGVYLYGIYLLDVKDKSQLKPLQTEVGNIEAALPEGIEKDSLALDRIMFNAAYDKTLSNGMKLLDGIKEYTRKWGNEVNALIIDAWRHINTPDFMGGSSKKALEAFLLLLPFVEGMVAEQKFSLFKGICTCYMDQKAWKDANVYYEKAAEIYPHEMELLEMGEKIRKKLK